MRWSLLLLISGCATVEARDGKPLVITIEVEADHQAVAIPCADPDGCVILLSVQPVGTWSDFCEDSRDDGHLQNQ